MHKRVLTLTLFAIVAFVNRSSLSAAKPAAPVVAGEQRKGVLWHQPENISTLDLYYGPGGEAHQPHAPFKFVQEDLDGTNPKYIVTDNDGVKWTVKVGIEARPEIAASRLVWAVGFFANEEYFISDLPVEGVPAQLKRGRKYVSADGTMHGARLKRHTEGEKSAGEWTWRTGPFAGTRELNGLKVMMALLNNWDLKDENNKVMNEKEGDQAIYEVSDLGATFGPNNLSFPFKHSRGDLRQYERSKFITKITPEYVDFRTPSRPSLMYAGAAASYIRRTRLDNLLQHVPRDDAKWMGSILAGLSSSQIRDAFRAAAYSPEEIESFSRVVEARIAKLNTL